MDIFKNGMENQMKYAHFFYDIYQGKDLLEQIFLMQDKELKEKVHMIQKFMKALQEQSA